MIKDKFGRDVRITRERLNHIIITHPEMKEFENELGEVLRNPDLVKRSVYDEEVLLYYKYFISIKKYITIVVKITTYSFTDIIHN